jgi:hypothetical protein
MLLALFTGPVYVAAAISALARRPLTYAVTAKGSLRSADKPRTFRLHVIWAALAGGLLFVSFRFHHDYTAMRLWACLAAVTGAGPLLIAAGARLRRGARAGREAAPGPVPRLVHDPAPDAARRPGHRAAPWPDELVVPRRTHHAPPPPASNDWFAPAPGRDLAGALPRTPRER